MANIFKNAVKYIGSTLKQVATNDTLKDFAHASRLFIGGNHRLAPKNAFLFHVYFDLNREAVSSIVAERNSQIELGMMVKNADLPRYTVDTKLYNSYNRNNIVQSKVRFDPINITFHDDNINVVRNFWYDYYKFYFRSSDHPDTTYTNKYKYWPQDDGRFGYTLRKETREPYLRSIRIYSLHQKRFSEYILLNPVIKNFRHGTHTNGADPNTMEHTMTIEYENILYNDGYVTVGNPPGFAQLHYDLVPSPLRVAGGVKSIFGTGGLLDSAGGVLNSIQNQDYLSAIFQAARTVNTFKGTNLKQAAISELTGIYTQEATAAVVGLINETMRPGNQNGYNIPTVGGINGAVSNQFNGIADVSSVAALAGAALLLNSTPTSNMVKKNPVVQATQQQKIRPNAPSLPLNPGTTKPNTTTSDLRIANDSAVAADTNQKRIDNSLARGRLDRDIYSVNSNVQRIANDIAAAQEQQQNTQTQITELNTRLAAAQAAPPSTNRTQVINDLTQKLAQMETLYNLATSTYAAKVTDLGAEQTKLDNLRSQREALNG